MGLIRLPISESSPDAYWAIGNHTHSRLANEQDVLREDRGDLRSYDPFGTRSPAQNREVNTYIDPVWYRVPALV